MSMRIAGLLALLLGPSVANAKEPTPVPGLPTAAAVEDGRTDKAEVAAFRETVKRYVERMGEFEGDARRWVDFREAEERGLLDSNYSAIIRDLDEDDRALRGTAARRFESFLEKYPDTVHSPHVMFRLAELYYEQTEEDFAVADAEFRRFMDNLSEEQFDQIPEEPTKNFRRSVALYEQIIERYPDYQYVDGCYYMLGYVLSERNSAQFDESAGLERFSELIRLFPKSQFASGAHLRMGEYYFDYNKIDEAIPHYEQVVALEGPEGSLYDEGLYKLAWSEYRRSNYDRGLVLLNQLLDWSEDYFARKGKESAMAPEAIEYTAISFSDMADLRGQHPLDVARSFYVKTGARPYEDKVYKRLADVLTQQARYDYAIDVYSFIQKRWPEDPENPDFMWKVATLHMSKSPVDREATQTSIRSLNELYGDKSAWWKANRNNPDALAVARGYIEKSLAGVATTYHTQALETGAPTDFQKAATYYREYLEKFPFAEDYYELQWYLAETLLRSGDTSGAQREYQQLLKAGDHNYKEASLWYLRAIAYGAVKDKYGPVQTLPQDAVVEEKVTTAGGERPRYQIGTDHQVLIDSSDAVVKADFGAALARIDAQILESSDKDKVETLKREREYVAPIAEGADKNRHAIAYQAAQILFAHGHYAEARPRLQEIIEGYQCTDEAAYSARLVVDTFIAEDDWSNVRKYSALYASQNLGCGQGNMDAVAELGDLEQRAALKEIEQLVSQDKREQAAEAYLKFISDYPKAPPEIIKNALYNAANNFERVGRLDDSIRLFKQFVASYPNDELSRPLYFRLADNYARALELDQAIKYYEALYNVTNGAGKPYGDAPAALFNAGFLRIGLSDYEGAARTFERYERENSGEPDAEQVLFMAAEQWGRVSPTREMSFLKDYLKRYPNQAPDHVIQALFRIAQLTEEAGRGRDADRAWSDLEAAYDGLAPSGKVGPAGRKYAAQAALRDVMTELDAFKTVPDKVKKSESKYAELLVQRKDELPAIEQRAGALVAKYKDFESSSAALYALGTAYLAYADMLYQAPVPAEVKADPEVEIIYYEELDKLRIPLEDKGKTRLVAVLDTAKQEHTWTQWQTIAIDELARRFPAEFAPEKQELRGVLRDSHVPRAAAQTVKLDAPATEAGATAPKETP